MVKNKFSVYDCSVIELSHLLNDSGNITPIETEVDIPFSVERIYYLYDIPGGESRGAHAHKNLYQLLVAAGGSFDVILDDGRNKRIVTLNRPYIGLLIVPGIWRELVSFSSGSTCLVLASMAYDESDYLRDYDDFVKFKKL